MASFLLTWCIAIPLGIWAALNRNRWIDRGLQLFSYISLSLPSFFLVMIFLFFASMIPGVLPLGGMMSPNYDDLNMFGKTWYVLHHLIIPATALSIGSIAGLEIFILALQHYRAQAWPEMSGQECRQAAGNLLLVVGAA